MIQMLRRLIAVAGLMASHAVLAGDSTPVFYASLPEFLAQIEGDFHEEGFDDVVAGPVSQLSFSGNGFAFTATSAQGLFNAPGVISISGRFDRLRITFTGNPVYAVGGNFWSTDANFNPTSGSITLVLADGTARIYGNSSPSSFGGFVSSSPIQFIEVLGADEYPVADNLIVAGRALEIFGDGFE